MVRADVFRKRILFDEKFIHGFEDWEFWLQCIEAGGYGVRVEGAGFLYRRRADSMLSDANRIGDNIVATMQSKHKSLYDRDALWALYKSEMKPIVFANRTGTLFKMSTSDHVVEITQEDLFKEYLAVYQGDEFSYFPKLLIYPIGDVDERPLIDDLGLQNILLTCEADKLYYLDAYGKVTSERQPETSYYLIVLAKLFSVDGAPEAVAEEPFAIAARQMSVSAKTLPRIIHTGRRYSGPTPAQVDLFLAGHLAGKVQPKASKSALLIAPREISGGLSAFKQCLSNILQIDSVNHQLFNASDRSNIRYTQYSGINLRYWGYSQGYGMLGRAASAYDYIYIADFDALFHVGEWKHFAITVIFVVSSIITHEQCVTLQAVEHSLAQIVCDAPGLRNLRALGIPSYKLMTIEDHLAHLEETLQCGQQR